VEGQGDLVCELRVGVREVGDVKAEVFVRRHHGQGFMMHVGGDAHLCHFRDDGAARLVRCLGDAGEIEVTA